MSLVTSFNSFISTFGYGGHIYVLPILIILAMLAAGSGLGGGVVYLSILEVFLGLQEHESVPISKAIIMGGTLIVLIINVRKRHPDNGRSLIYFDAFFLMEPLTVVGTEFGVMLNEWLPVIVLRWILVVVLAYVLYSQFKKAIRVFKTESKSASYEKLLPNKIYNIRDTFPLVDFLLFVVFWIIFLVLSIMIDFNVMDPAIFQVLKVVLALIFTLVFHLRVLKRTDDSLLEGGNLIKFGLLAILAGIVASSIGLGGGVVKVPALSMLGKDILTVTSTSSAMIFFTASSSSIQYLATHAIDLKKLVFHAVIGFLSFFLGKTVIDRIIKKTGHRSYALFALSTLIFIGFILIFRSAIMLSLE
ncbi:hypothetical protein PCE1_000972 [Barthelona sp. PCE]